MNPNNCSTCDFKARPQGGHCYMFREPPKKACGQHTVRKVNQLGEAILARVDFNKPYKAKEQT